MNVCGACNRHVRERVCPFCGGDAPLISARPRARTSRTARFLGVAALGVACGGTTAPAGDGGGADATEDVSPQPMYGAVIPDAGNDATIKDASSDAADASDADADAPNIALYGAPPPPKDGG